MRIFREITIEDPVTGLSGKYEANTKPIWSEVILRGLEEVSVMAKESAPLMHRRWKNTLLFLIQVFQCRIKQKSKVHIDR